MGHLFIWDARNLVPTRLVQVFTESSLNLSPFFPSSPPNPKHHRPNKPINQTNQTDQTIHKSQETSVNASSPVTEVHCEQATSHAIGKRLESSHRIATAEAIPNQTKPNQIKPNQSNTNQVKPFQRATTQATQNIRNTQTTETPFS